MTTRTKSIVAFALYMALAAGIYLWTGPLNRGTIAITGEIGNSVVSTVEGTTQCAADPCLVSMTSGIHELTVQKDGYFPEMMKVMVKRFKTESVTVALKKIPSLKESQVVPAEKRRQEKPLPEAFANQGIESFAWDPKGESMAMWDPSDEKLKLWSNDVLKTITPLKKSGIPLRLVWSPAQDLLLAVAGRDLYRIDTQAAAKKKAIMGFDPSHFTWSDHGDFILVNDPKNKVHRLAGQTLAPEALDVNVNLEMAVLARDGKLIYAVASAEENKTTIKAYDFASKLESEITAKFDFPISKIVTDENGSIYFFNDKQQTWFLLDF